MDGLVPAWTDVPTVISARLRSRGSVASTSDDDRPHSGGTRGLKARGVSDAVFADRALGPPIRLCEQASVAMGSAPLHGLEWHPCDTVAIGHQAAGQRACHGVDAEGQRAIVGIGRLPTVRVQKREG